MSLDEGDFIEEEKEFLKGKGLIKEIPRIERFAGHPALSEIFGNMKTKPSKDKRIYVAHVQYGYTLKEMADFLGIHYSTLSKALKKAKGGKKKGVSNNSKIKT